MNVMIVLGFREDGKRMFREVSFYSNDGVELTGPDAPKDQLLLPTKLPKEWMLGATHVGRSAVVVEASTRFGEQLRLPGGLTEQSSP